MLFSNSILFASLTLLSIYQVIAVNSGDPCYLLWIRQHGTCELESECHTNGTSFYSAACNSNSTFHNENKLICCPKEKVKRSVSGLFPRSPYCGRSIYDDNINDRIVGGYLAYEGSWPWIVMIGTKFSDHTISWTCGGALISNKWIATAAHCYFEAEGALNWTRLGALNLMKPTSDSLDMRIKLFILNEKYVKGRLIEDIALAKLESAITFTDYIRPICLPSFGAMRYSDYNDEIAYVAGWGTTKYNGLPSNRLRELHVDIIDRNTCKQIYKQKKAKIIKSQLCAGSLTEEEDACQGDSGGPLILYDEDENSAYLIGIVSYGFKCAVKGYPGVYTKVAEFISWIEDTVRKNSNT